MASLLSSLSGTAGGIGSTIGSAARGVNSFMAKDIGGMTGADVLPAGVQGAVRPSMGATGVNWGQLAQAARSRGNTRDMMPLVQGKRKDGDLDDILSIVGGLFGGGV